MEREQKKQIIQDLTKKIVFLVGPRQAGKTWLAKDIGLQYEKTVYLNYDRFEDRDIIRKEEWLEDIDLLILDELHKMKNWKNYLKGVYDTKPSKLKILVTGSARLDTFRQSGDSLAGRYFLHHLLPFSLAELKKQKREEGIDRLLKRGGFPEPFLAASDVDADRWRKQYVDGLIREDILNFQKIDDLKAIRLVFETLKRKVGSPISYSAIAGDIGISSVTVKKYINILEALYIIFKITPYTKKISRSILKEPKIYFFDNGLVEGGEGFKFENLIAASLYKHVVARQDYLGKNDRLHYLRTKENREVDFVIASDDADQQIIEAKLSDSLPTSNLRYFAEKYGFSATQVVKNLKRERLSGGIKVRRAQNYLQELYL